MDRWMGEREVRWLDKYIDQWRATTPYCFLLYPHCIRCIGYVQYTMHWIVDAQKIMN